MVTATNRKVGVFIMAVHKSGWACTWELAVMIAHISRKSYVILSLILLETFSVPSLQSLEAPPRSLGWFAGDFLVIAFQVGLLLQVGCQEEDALWVVNLLQGCPWRLQWVKGLMDLPGTQMGLSDPFGKTQANPHPMISRGAKPFQVLFIESLQ